MDLSENIILKDPEPNEIIPKGSELCAGCKLYKEKCHCKCHKGPLAHGFHEIIYDMGGDP